MDTFQEFINLLKKYDFYYEQRHLDSMTTDNVQKLKIIIYTIRDIYLSTYQNILNIAKRETFIDTYLLCKDIEKQYLNTEKQIEDFYSYYKRSVINKLLNTS